MDPYAEFDRLMTYLEDWYADSTRAAAPDADRGHGASEAGHRILHANRYPGPRWRYIWKQQAQNDPGQQQLIISALRDEVYGLDHSPSQSGPASGLHRGTKEWRLAVASADGSLRAVARRFGISHTEVARIRAEVTNVR